LRRWHPGVGVAVPADAPHSQWRGYHQVKQAADESQRATTTTPTGLVTADPAAVDPRVVGSIRRLLSATAERTPLTSCFGLHEWAMVYRDGDARRHIAWPLRLGAAETDDVVETHPLRCTHIDAQRFFTSAALPLIRTPASRETQHLVDQPGCVHVTMDLYKWAYRLEPLTPSDLTLACFRLARDARELDMRASPYDLAALGYDPIPIETPLGRRDYVTAQRSLTERAAPLRRRLLDVCEAVHPVTSSAA
jgi:hypothetical protein